MRPLATPSLWPRHRQDGLIHQPDGTLAPCTVLDASATEARIAFDSFVSTPPEFSLTIHGEPRARRCETAWRSATEIGIRFIDERAESVRGITRFL